MLQDRVNSDDQEMLHLSIAMLFPLCASSHILLGSRPASLCHSYGRADAGFVGMVAWMPSGVADVLSFSHAPVSGREIILHAGTYSQHHRHDEGY